MTLLSEVWHLEGTAKKHTCDCGKHFTTLLRGEKIHIQKTNNQNSFCNSVFEGTLLKRKLMIISPENLSLLSEAYLNWINLTETLCIWSYQWN